MAMPNVVDLRGRRDPCETNTISAPASWWRAMDEARGASPRASYIRAAASLGVKITRLADEGDADCAAAVAKAIADGGDGE